MIYFTLYIAIGIFSYLILDKAISKALKADPGCLDTEEVDVTPALLESIKIFLSLIWPLSFIILLVSNND